MNVEYTDVDEFAGTGSPSETVVSPVIPVNKIFDFTPFAGTLDPGETEETNVRYWGFPNHEVFAVAVCRVVNGPEYLLKLVGRFSLNTEVLSSCLHPPSPR